MPSLFRPTIIAYTLAGKSYTPDGTRVTKNTPGAERSKYKASRYYGRFKDANGNQRTVPLCADKSAAKQMLAKLVTDANLAGVGLGDTFASHRKRPLVCAACKSTGKRTGGSSCPCPVPTHLTDYRRCLQACGNVPDHVAKVRARIAALVAGCKFTWLADIAPGPVLEWLAKKRRDGMSVSTSNGYLAAIRSFTRWLCRDRRMPADPLAYVARLNAKPHLTRVRRALSEEQLRDRKPANGRNRKGRVA